VILSRCQRACCLCQTCVCSAQLAASDCACLFPLLGGARCKLVSPDGLGAVWWWSLPVFATLRTMDYFQILY